MKILLFATFLHTLRLIVESIFCYFVYNCKNKNETFQKCSVKKIAIFSSVHVTMLSLYRHLFTDYITYRLVSVLIIFAYFWIENRIENKRIESNNARNWSYILTFAVFITLMTEYSYSMSHIIVRFSWKLLDMYDVSITNLLLDKLYRFTILSMHICFIFLIYKFRFIKMRDIKNLSVYKQIPVLFGLCLSTIVYIKYSYIQLDNDPYRDIFLWIFMFLLPTYLGFYWMLSKLSQLINVKKNYSADENIFIWIFNPSMIETFHLNIYDSELFTPTYEFNKLNFKRKLARLGIDNSCKGFSSLVFCLILTKLFMGLKCWSFERDVFGQASIVIDIPFPEVRKDIENIIKKTWLLEEPKKLIDGYYRPCCNRDLYDDSQPPTVEEFLVCMVKST